MAVRGNVAAFDLVDGASSYGKWDADSQYTYESGILVLPVASEASLTVTVRTHGGYATRQVHFDIAKQGNPPVIPAAQDIVGNDRLIGTQLVVSNPSPNPNTGGYNWSVRGLYTYVTSAQPRIPGNSIFPTVSFPYPNPTQDAIAANTFQNQTPAQYAQTMIQTDAIMSDKWVWASTDYPSTLLGNPFLIGP